MHFNELDQKMRVYETAHDYCVPDGFYMVARLDGRNFTKLTRETIKAEAPFDTNFRDAMVETVERLMRSGFGVKYGYTQSDEISLLLDEDDYTFNRKLRKYDSVLAGEASATFSLAMQTHAVFDCRISILPNQELVKDYFCWRMEDAFRNSLNSYAYWTQRKNGKSEHEATVSLLGAGTAYKNELLFGYGINFNEAPTWQKRGVGLYWEDYQKQGYNPLTLAQVLCVRRHLVKDYELPQSVEEYQAYLGRVLANPTAKT